MICAISGAAGYVGSRVADHMLGRGWDVRSLSRRPSPVRGASHVQFSLADGLEPEALDGVDALIHCAWDFGARGWGEIAETNVEGSRRLFDAAVAAGVEQLVFVSTLSAFPGARSMYGRAKLAVEEHVHRHGGAVVRPGLVFGPDAGAMVGTLTRIVQRQRVVPLMTGERQRLHAAHERDLAALLAALAAGEERADRQLVAAGPDSYSLRQVMEILAESQGRPAPVFVRVPWRLVHAGLSLLERAGLDPPLRADSALSLATLEADPFRHGAAPASVRFRPFAASTVTSDEPAAELTRPA